MQPLQSERHLRDAGHEIGSVALSSMKVFLQAAHKILHVHAYKKNQKDQGGRAMPAYGSAKPRAKLGHHRTL